MSIEPKPLVMECYGRRRKVVSGTCAVCSKEYFRPKSRLGTTCSRECADAERSQHRDRSVETECTQCKSVFRRKFSKLRGVNRFCGQKCRDDFNTVRRRNARSKTCLHCGNPSKQDTCSRSCTAEVKYKAYIDRWKLGQESGQTGAIENGALSDYVRRYMLEKSKFKCSECGWCRVHPTTGRIPLTVDHIDGNSQNSIEVNLKVLCPSCHALTPTYGSLNIGAGRLTRRKLILEKVKPLHSTKYYTQCKYCQKSLEVPNQPTGYRYCNAVCKKLSTDKWPSDEDLSKMVWEDTALNLAKRLGISSSAIKKRCKGLGITTPPRGYWQKLKASV